MDTLVRLKPAVNYVRYTFYIITAPDYLVIRLEWFYIVYVIDKAAILYVLLKMLKYMEIFFLLSNISVQNLNIEYLGFACAVNMGCEYASLFLSLNVPRDVYIMIMIISSLKMV